MRWPPGSLLLTRHADVQAVYRSPQASSDKRLEFAPRLGAGSPIYEHPHHQPGVQRPAIAHARAAHPDGCLEPACHRAHGKPAWRRWSGACWTNLPDRPAPDLVTHFAAQIPVDVIGNLLAVPVPDRAPLQGWSLDILSALEPAPAASVLARANEAVTAFSAYLAELVAERRRHPGDPEADVLTRLIAGDDEGGLSEPELLHNCIFLLNAGTRPPPTSSATAFTRCCRTATSSKGCAPNRRSSPRPSRNCCASRARCS